MQKKHNNQNSRNTQHVTASVVAEKYSVTPRFILQLASEGKIPAIRIGKKCVRFDLEQVKRVLEEGGNI